MTANRASIALVVVCSLLASLGGGALPGRAQVEEAEQEAEEAEERVEEAYRIVDAATENREAVEAELAATLARYQETARALTAANADLERIRRSLAFAESSATTVEQDLETQAVAAYMTAVVSTPAVVLDTETMEDALVTSHAFSQGQDDALSRLDELLIRRQELERIRTEFREERDRVAALNQELEREAGQLEELFAQANAEVAAAFQRAQEAESEYRAALDDVDRARAAAAEERRRREEANRTTTTTTPTTTAPDQPEGETTTPTTQPPDDDPPSITITAATMQWQPLIDTHFAPDLRSDALVIVECESGGDPDAVNPYSGAAGLFQFLPGTWAVASVKAGVGDASVFDPEANIIAAAWLAEYYRDQGRDPWTPWTCRSYL